jgi:hypothetical protein
LLSLKRNFASIATTVLDLASPAVEAIHIPSSPGIGSPRPTDHPVTDLRTRQLEIETKTLGEACKKYKEMLSTLVGMGKTSQLSSAQRKVVDW